MGPPLERHFSYPTLLARLVHIGSLADMGVCQSMSALPQKAVRLDPSQRKIGDDVINLFVLVCFLPSGLAKTNGLVRWDVGAICFWGAGPTFKAKGAAGEKRPLRWRARTWGRNGRAFCAINV